VAFDIPDPFNPIIPPDDAYYEDEVCEE